ncbi:MAG: sugar phosphate isomerase/epimerase [Acidimicrobiales bacterium]|jgi:sugar phosphate isomerase/epimerase|nr:sugar phosphate isomerase/epimerase [Acidimicrobiales bacterium]
MRVGVDSYSFHRFFGELRAGEDGVETSWNTVDFISTVKEMGVDGISLETCFFENEKDIWNDLEDISRQGDIELVIAWGHPYGLEMGLSRDAFLEVRETISRSADAGIFLIRIVIGTYIHWNKEHPKETVDRTVPILADLCNQAERLGVEIAVETHCDLPVNYLLKLLKRVNSPSLGIVLDTGNIVRIGEDLQDSTRLLAPYVKMVHVKDLIMDNAPIGDPGGLWLSPSIGEGDLDIKGCLTQLANIGFKGMACVEIGSIPSGCDEVQMVRKGIDWLRKAGI